MKVMCFANHAPDEIIAMLKKSGVTDIKIVNGKDPEEQHVIVLGVNTFFRHERNREKRYYVVDNPMAIMSTNLQKVDLEEEEDLHIDGISIKRLEKIPPFIDNDNPSKVPYNIVHVATQIAKSQQTFLNQFMTFIYSLPSETHQTPVKKLVCKWMASNESINSLQKKVELLRKTVPLNDKQVKRLFDIIDTEVTVKYRQALQQSGDEDDVAKAYRVSAYELRYIRAVNKGKDK